MITRLLTRAFGGAKPGLGGWAESGLGRTTFPIEVGNTLTNLAYPVVGLWVWATHPGPEAVAWAALMALLGLGSALYHGWPTDDPDAGALPLSTRDADHGGMYGSFTGLVMWAAAGPWWAILGAGLAAAVVGARARWPTEWAMGAALVVTVAMLTVRGPDGGIAVEGAQGLAAFVLSYGAWQLGRERWWVGAWGHRIWHLGTALAMGLMARGVP